MNDHGRGLVSSLNGEEICCYPSFKRSERHQTASSQLDDHAHSRLEGSSAGGSSAHEPQAALNDVTGRKASLLTWEHSNIVVTPAEGQEHDDEAESKTKTNEPA